MTTTLTRPSRPSYPISLADEVFLLTRVEETPTPRRRRRSLARRLGPTFTVLVALIGMTLGMYVGFRTPPMSGGTLAALFILNVFGALIVRVLFVVQRREELR